ncbi:MAG TPA: hypothetical protein VEW25_06415 [Allosphingosinicella sp.]|nr:hypothetical protein [Allosphingosinicella sp.]
MRRRPGLLDRLLPDGPADEAGPGYDLRPAWRRGDADIERDAIAFWNRLGILPQGVRPEDRARELVAVAYQGDRLVGVATAALGRIEALKARFAMLRGAVEPEHRRSRLGFDLAVLSRELIETWSRAHPEERVLGLGAIVESPDLAERARRPLWPQTRLNLIGYTPEGRQIRVAWFAHAELDRGQSP